MDEIARETYRAKLNELEASLAETRERLNELQRAKQGSQRFILSQEQQTEIEKFRKKESEVDLQLKEERKKLRRDIDSLENRLKLANIGIMPLLVAAFGITLAAFKRKRTSAK